MSYHLLGSAAAPAPAAAPSSAPITVTAGIPGFNVSIPVTSTQRAWFAAVMTVLVGVAGGAGIAALIKRAKT